jgi:hypothetical protein
VGNADSLGGVISSGYVKWIDVDTDTLLAGNSDVKTISQKAAKTYIDNVVAGGIEDGDKGEISVTSGVWTVDNSVITYAKLQSINQNEIMGRYSSGSGSPQGLILGSAFSLAVDTIKVSYTNLLNKPTLGSLAGMNSADTAYTLAKVISVNGYKGIVSLSKSDLSLGNVENTALSTWAGSSNITTLGTISTGSIPESKLTFTDITTGNVSTSYHGFVPKAPNDTTKFLDGTGNFTRVDGGDLRLSDNTTNNVSTSMHGFAPKTPNDTTKFLSGDGTYDYIHDADVRTTRLIKIKLILDATTATTSDSVIVTIPEQLTGMNLVDADVSITTVSSSGTPTFTITNVTDATTMLSTSITIDANEYTSYTAATAPVINASYDDVVTGDRIKIKCTVAGTGAKGTEITLGFQKP